MAAEGRDTATPEEQEILSGFTGWGQFPTLFNTTSSEWTKERKQLKDLLSADEFKAADSASGNTNKPSWHAASRATLNSHFTSPQIVDAHWQAAQRLGFDGGRYLEPSIGSGYYVGMMPEELAKKTSVTGVELDRTTAQVAQALYPSASIRHQGFEQFQAPDNFFDLAASNVPFGDYPIHERRYNRFQAPIHDHFFLKSLDKVRPGGLVMHITSTGTMDKGNSRIRKEMASQADLIAAIRLPGKTHADAAGTEVVTDLIILRKRTDAGEAPEETPEDVQPDPGYTGVLTDSLGRVYHFVDGKRVANDFWVETTTVPDPAGGEDIPVNQYFADNPQQILGTLDRTGTMYRSDSKNVTPPEDFDGALQAAIERLPEGIYKPSDGTRTGTPELVATDVKNGTLSIRDGEAVQYRSGAYYRIDVPKAAIDRIADADKLRNTLRDLIGQDKAGETSDEARVRLNEHYDAFVKAHGALHDTANLRTLAQDPDMPLLLSLENWDAKKKKATKADIFEHNTIRPGVSVTSAESIIEGLGVSLNETGRVDVEMIASLTGMTKEHVEDEFRHSGLAFHDPEQGWQSRAEYLSGNVRHKLKLAQAAAEQDPNFKPNVLALEANQPDEIAHDDISARLGVPWIPREDMNSFAAHLLNGEAKDFDIRYVSATGGWVADYARGGNNWISSGPAANAWGTPRKSFMTILDAALNNKSIKVYGDEDADGKKQLDKKATDDVRGKIQDMRDAFAEWLWSSPERRSRLHKLYNDEYNNIRPMEYDGSHLTYPGMNPSFKMRSVQDNFVWQTITRGKGILAHEVGIGKTSTMVAAAMELRRLGLAKKPAIVCLKANLEQLTADAQSLYPGARILSTSGQFTADKRKEMVSRIATGDYDMVFMSHDHLNMLPMSSEVQQRFISQEIEELEAAAALVQTEDKSRKSNAVKALEKRKATLEARLQKAIDSKKDDQITFEETGIDFLMVDEAQAYKNLPVYTSMQELAGISSAPSDRASNMLMRTRWLQEQHDGRGVVFATGTPISNSMAEMYSLQRYLQPEELEARGLTTFDAWANTFGEFETSLEPDLKGGYKSKTRFSNFVNVPELMQIARQDMDVRRVDSLPPNPDKSPAVLRPNKREHMVLAPATDVVKSMMTDIHSRARAIEGKRAEKGADNPLSITTAGRQGSVDPRLYDSSFEDHPDSKVNKMVRNVLERYKDPEFKGQTQLIFSDIGVHPNGSSGFHLYGDIIDKLVKGGIPREEIADFSQLEGKARLDAASRLRSGKTRIAIGGTERLGTGLNVQTRLTALHHIDVPYKPAATEQRNGRGHRFGNQNKDIDVFHYITEGSLDEMSWGIVGRKANFIKQAVTDPKAGQRRISEEDAEALTPQQLMAAASGDMRILERVNLRSQVDTLTRARSRHERNQEELKSRSVSAARKVENLVAQAKRVASDSSAVSKDFHIDVNGKQTTDSTKAKEMLADAIAEADQQQHAHRSNVYPYREPDPVHIGSVRGLKLLRDAGSYTLEGPSGERYRTGDSLQSIEHVIRNLPKREETLKAEAAHTRGDIESITRQIGKTFSQAAALEAARANLDRLDKELKGEQANPLQMSEQYSRSFSGFQSALFAALRQQSVERYAKTWQEQQHPRAADGRFGDKAGQHDTASKIKDAAVLMPDAIPEQKSAPKSMPMRDPVESIADYKANGTRSAAFKDWFGDWESDPANASKVVDENGEPQPQHGSPQKVYHGTTGKQFESFSKEGLDSKALYGPGFYFTADPHVAQSYAALRSLHSGEADTHVIEAYMRIQKPFDADRDTFEFVDGKGPMTFQAARMHMNYTSGPWDRNGDSFVAEYCNKKLQAAGYDGITHTESAERFQHFNAEATADEHRVWIAFEPNQIKSTDNQGTFDMDDNRMKYQRDRYAGLFDEAKHPRDHGKFAKKPGVAGQQMGLFHGDEQPGQQKTLFNVVKPKASSKQQVAAKIQASLLERIEDDLKRKSVDAKPLAGQKELFSRVRSDMTRFIASQYNDDIDRYDMPGQRDLFSGGERRSTKTQGKMRWVTIGGHADGEAQHAGGQAVKIDGDGTIIGGNVPKSWQGQNVRTAASGGSAGGGRPGSQDQQSAPVAAPAQKQGQPVTLGVKQLGNRWYAMATLPDGKMVTRSHDDREAAVKLGHDDIERAGHHVGGEQSHLKGLWNTMKKGEAATQPAASSGTSSGTSSVDAAIGTLTHVQNVDQVTGQAGSIWDNMESARKEYPDRKEFAKAVADKWREGRAAAFDAKRGGERHDDLLGASRAAFKHNGQTIDADAAAQRAADRAAAPVAEESADTDYGWQDPPFEKMPGEMSDAGRAIEQKTQQRARDDYAKFRAAYVQKNGRLDADGNLAAITLNTDEWREHFPEYHGTNASEVHEACSYLNKRLLNEALHTLKGKGNNTILTLAGGGGSGKGTATQEFLAGKDYPIILDQVSDKVTKSFDAIKKAKDNGYDAEIMYVDREPSDAFRNGVRSRALHSRKKGEPARTVPVDIALKANIAARNAMVELIQSNPDSKWSVVNNNNGYGQAVQLTNPEDAVQFLQRQDFDFESLKEAMTNDTKRLHERGELPDDIAEGLLPGYTVKNGRLQPRSASGSNRDGSQDEREGSGGVSGAEDQGAAHRSSGEGTEAAGGGIPEPGTDGFMNVNDLERDPTRFQYKMNTNAEGVTNQFSDVKYNPMLGGKLAVWKDPENGKAYVVNGHHRHELAQRSGYDGQVTVHHIDAKTHEEARAFGALINIAGGNGTAVDAAKFMRDTGTSLDEMSEKGVSVTQGMGRDAGILAKLSPRLFGQLAQGLYRQGRALAIGQHLDNHEDQERVSKLVDQREDKTGRTVSDTTVAEIARQAAVASRTTEKQKGLFGEEEDDRSLFIERAELVGGLRRQMAERLNKFKAVSTDKAAGVLSENNSIDAGANRAEADRLRNQVADFDRESTLRGPVGDILNKAAKEYADEPKRKPEILKRLASDISEHFANLQSGPRSGDGPDRPEQSDSSGGIEERQPYKSAPGQRDFFSRQRSGQRSVRMTDPVALASAITSRIMERV